MPIAKHRQPKAKSATSVRGLMRKAKAKRKPAVQPNACGPIVSGADYPPKSGCYFCPVLPWSKDWADQKPHYARDGEKIRAKEKDGHVVRHRCIGEKPTEVDVLFVGGSPSVADDGKNEPFVGRAGKLLREAMADQDVTTLKPEQIGYTFAARCTTVRNRPPSNTIVNCCTPALVREIELRRPKLLVALGGVALERLTGMTGITAFQGKVLDCTLPGAPKGLQVLACMQPSYVLRMDQELEKFCQTLALAQTYIEGDYVPLPGPGEYEVLTTAKDVESVMRRLTNSQSVVAFDIESGHLSPFDTKFPQLLCVSFSNAEGQGYVVPWNHSESPWVRGLDEKSRARVYKAMRKFFESDAPKIGHNQKFDCKHILKALGVSPNNVVGDSMLLHFVLDERRGTHGLKPLAHAYTGMGGYDRPLDRYIQQHPEANSKKGGSYANIPASLLFPYAGMDADVTLRIYNRMREDEDFKANPKFRRLADDFMPALSDALADMEYDGAQVDTDVVAVLDVEYRARMKDYARQIRKFPEVKKFVRQQRQAGKTGKKKADKFYFNPGSHTQLQKVLFEIMGERPTLLTDKGFEVLAARYARLVSEEKKQRKGQAYQTAINFQAVVSAAIERKEWEFFSTKADVLHECERRGNTLAPLILVYREYETLHGTFIKPLLSQLDSNGRIHGSFLPHGTTTGRLASRSPNLQNIPNKGGGMVKRAYCSRFGDEGVLVQLDYSQIELRIAASWFNERQMIKAYKNGADLHTLTAIVISGLSVDQYKALTAKEQKAWRTRAKRVNFGVLYGGGPPALQSTLKKDGVFVTIDECKKLIEDYFRSRKDLKSGIERLKRQTKKKGYLEAFTGFRRRVPEVFNSDEQIIARALRQSINFPIQHGGAVMTLISLIIINREMKARGLKSRIVLTVHDSIVFDCPVDEAFEVAELGVDIMERLPELSDEVLPGIDWNWLKVPIVADADIGVSWGQMVGFDAHDYDVDEVWERLTIEAEKPLDTAKAA